LPRNEVILVARRTALLLVAIGCGAAALSWPAAAASPPQAVTITIDETFYAPPAVPAVTGDITASGGVFGSETKGTLASVAFKPVGWLGRRVQYPFPDHLFVYSATDEYTFAGGMFEIKFEASCNLTSVDWETGAGVLACAGNWQVNGGTGSYAHLKGTGTFTEIQNLDSAQAGTGSIVLTGTMHAD
jgi:hypothetical protein